jgi:2-hydroxychromene-2-carboxylate isomerase
MKTLEFFFDCGSPWTYLAFHALRPMARADGFAIAFRPILVGGVFNAVNDTIYRFRESGPAPKHAYMAKDLADWARHAGLRIVWPPSVFPVNSVHAMRGCIVAARAGRLEDLAEALFAAYWGADRDIGNPAEVADLAAGIGLDRPAFLAALNAPETKAELRRNTEELIARGGFGSPTMFVNGDDMYFGNDRLPLVREAMRR